MHTKTECTLLRNISIGDASIAMARIRCPKNAFGFRRIEDKDEIKKGSFHIYPINKLTAGLAFWESVKNLPGFTKYELGSQGILIMKMDPQDSNFDIHPSLFNHGVGLIDLARKNRETNAGTPDGCTQVEFFGASTIARSTNGGVKICASLKTNCEKNKNIVGCEHNIVSIDDESIKNGCINQYPGMSDPYNYLLIPQGIASLKKSLAGRYIQISYSYTFKDKNQQGKGKSTESLCWVTGLIKSVIQEAAGTANSVRLTLQYIPLFKHEKQTVGAVVIHAGDFSTNEVSSKQGQWRLLSKKVSNTKVVKPKLRKKSKQSKPSMNADVLIAGIKLRCVMSRETVSRRSSKTTRKSYSWPDLSFLDEAAKP